MQPAMAVTTSHDAITANSHSFVDWGAKKVEEGLAKPISVLDEELPPRDFFLSFLCDVLSGSCCNS